MAAYDFAGWATKNDIRCADGRTIRRDAFKDDDGKKVPLVFNHNHEEPEMVLGHAILRNKKDGVWAECYFNNTEKAQITKELVKHGDLGSLSIYANKLTQSKNKDVVHGTIREVSLVLAGANPGATIEFPMFMHSDDSYDFNEEEALIKCHIEGLELYHGEDLDEEEKEDEVEEVEQEEKAEEVIEHADSENKKEEETKVADEAKKPEGSGKTIGEVFDTLNEDQKTAVYAIIGQALEDAKGGSNEEDSDVKHNLFDTDDQYEGGEVLSQEEIQQVFADAKRLGSLKEACIQHSIDTTGMDTAVGQQTYGFNDVDMLLPEYKSLNNPPEWIKRNTEWVSSVINGASKTPFSRIKSLYANITEDDARARGYMKGGLKKEEVFTTLKRVTGPCTIYKKQKLDRDDILDITDFDIVPWIKSEMEVMLDEELARAILIGDGRDNLSEDKIKEDCIRPIAKDVPLFNIPVSVEVEAGATGAEKADAVIEGVLRARKNYKGSGNPTLYTTEDWLTEMLLLKDGIGHRLYKTEAELATALRVSKIVTVEVMEGQKIDSKDLVGVIVNMKDYNLGNDKNAAKGIFDDFDIDYNQYKYLIETRRSGALVRPFSAMTVTISTAAQANG
ncbi:MAG: HK97 family phage prohead protease [Pseudobutyrivibrio sp.]|nr:HK97 family phage prohead protease [Pseudobutyrivibrio sp.]